MNHFETKRHKERMELESVLTEHKLYLLKRIKELRKDYREAVKGNYESLKIAGCLGEAERALEHIKELES